MNSIVEISKAFVTRKEQEKVILKNTKTLKVFEVNSVVQTLFGAEEKQVLIKDTCPKRAIVKNNQHLISEGTQVFEVKNIVAPNKNKGYVTYVVFNNKHILR